MPSRGQRAENRIVVADVSWISNGEKDTQASVLLTLSAQISYYLQVRTRATSFTRHNDSQQSPLESASSSARSLEVVVVVRPRTSARASL